MNKAELKVKGGKLIKCRIELEDNNIRSVRYTGDFFLHPEEYIEKLEESLTGVAASPERVKQIIEDFFKKPEITLIGASPEDFVKVTLTCLEALE
ncbi:MAG: hypothetical protein OdinLCB4_001280 [Candidatus Odinarchaeum yellowstonii]|uniref:lipoate--protein ligase n=1 Tax=Odinarchaeota yellowstonii (strain LCB_4) TaxID=1841599 RepID=A0AAF0D2U8_ODILC|nr:MAG: hypothetical protein OdinLCB4_001280 [Candidatus Odinarchaeum yellowstonii]